MLESLKASLAEAVASAPVTDPVTDPVIRLLHQLQKAEAGTTTLMKALRLSHRATFRDNYIDPALVGQWIERSQPNSPNSPTQRYRLTQKGRDLLARLPDRKR